MSTLLSEGCDLWELFISVEDLPEYRLELGGHGVELARRKHRVELELINGHNLRAGLPFTNIVVSG
jgi:hypothetical protein